MMKTWAEEITEQFEKRNEAIRKANARIKQMEQTHEVWAREGLYGIEITTKLRGVPSGRGYESMYHTEFIPF